ncbi:MAG: hypothetical protein C5B54_04765 [Acidobacteria bacterium]|nr:MAG: hypothetical protein C5B54_04765 [Acidobacteriota bacterium]
MQKGAYHTTYSRALFKQSSSGFNARYLDADDLALIERIRDQGSIAAGGLGDLQRSAGNFGFYGGRYTYATYNSNPSYRDEEDAAEAHGFEIAYKEVSEPEPEIEDDDFNEKELNRHYSADAKAARKRRLQAAFGVKLDPERPRYFSVSSAEAEKERAQHYVIQARRRIAFMRARAERRAELAERERLNRAYSRTMIEREMQTAEMEFDWYKIERDRLIARISRDRRNYRRALKAAERELRRTGKILRTMRRKLDEHDNQGYSGHPGQDTENLGPIRSEGNLSDTGQSTDGPRSDNPGFTEGGSSTCTSGTREDSTDDSRAA